MKITDVTMTQLFCPQNDSTQISIPSAPRSQASKRGRLLLHAYSEEGSEPNPAALEQRPA